MSHRTIPIEAAMTRTVATILWALACVVPASAQQIAYIPIKSGNTVVVYGAGANTVVTTITGFTTPLGVAVRPDGDEAYIMEASGDVRIIETATNTIADTIHIGDFAWSAIFSPDGSRAYVSTADARPIQVIDTASRTIVAEIAGTGYTHGLAVSPDGKKVYSVNHSGLDVIDTQKNSLVMSYPTGGCPYDVEVSPDGERLYVVDWCLASVIVLDAGSGTPLATIDVGFSFNIALSPDGTRLYVPDLDSSSIKVIDTGSLMVTGSFAAPATWPLGIAFTPDGRELLVTHDGRLETTVLVNAGAHTTTSSLTVGGDPHMIGNPFPQRVARKVQNVEAKGVKLRSREHKSIKHKSVKHRSMEHRSMKHKSMKHKSV